MLKFNSTPSLLGAIILVFKSLHIGGREGQAAMNPKLDLPILLSQEIEIYKDKEEK